MNVYLKHKKTTFARGKSCALFIVSLWIFLKTMNGSHRATDESSALKKRSDE